MWLHLLILFPTTVILQWIFNQYCGFWWHGGMAPEQISVKINNKILFKIYALQDIVRKKSTILFQPQYAKECPDSLKGFCSAKQSTTYELQWRIPRAAVRTAQNRSVTLSRDKRIYMNIAVSQCNQLSLHYTGELFFTEAWCNTKKMSERLNV